MNPWRPIGAILFVLLLAALAAGFYQTGQARDARDRAESLSSLRLDAAALAKTRSVEARDARKRADEVVKREDERRQDADRQIRALRAQNAAVTDEAAQSGESVLETVRALQGANEGGSPADLEALVLAHLEADRQLAEINERERVQWVIALEAEEARSGAFEMRAISAEFALDASEMACQICELEAEAWKEAASPGWFARLRQNVPSMLLAAGATALALLVL